MPVSIRCLDEWLIRLLISDGALSEREIDGVRGEGARYASAGLLSRGLLTKKELAATVENHYRIAFAEPSFASIDKMALSLLPESLCRKYRVVPLKVYEDKIEVLMENPLDATALEEVGAVSGRRAVPCFGLPDKIEELMTQVYSPDAIILDLLKKMPEDEPVEWIEGGSSDESGGSEFGAIGAPVIRLANLLISQAIRMKASDIHIEHEENLTQIRYRVDGVLRNIMKVPKHVGEGPLVSRIKIMANLDIADRRRPQDGRAKLRVGMRDIGLRVSTIPTAFGEKAVLRILDQQQAEVGLDALGFRPELLSKMAALSESNQGLFLITGPTGSGKTTTLYSLLQRLKSADINIVTVEDPIEYRLPGVNQVQVNEKAGLNFASVLRSVLRQDPDVVLVGEIRDRETADIAFQASLTGHLVFSTLHTNDAIATINRLLDMGVELYKMAPAFVCIVSQRLARRVCQDCRAEETPQPGVAAMLREMGLPERQFRGSGCVRCAHTGLSGRTTVTELLDLSSQEARDLVNAGVETAAFRERALQQGWLSTMQQDVLWHLAQGDISFEEAVMFLGPEAFRRHAVPASVVKPVEQDERAFGRPRAEVPAVARENSAQVQVGAPGNRVLIVDDNWDNRALVRDVLRAEGYDLVESEDGMRALEEIARRRPDLVLLDVMMPQLDGFAVLKRLRQSLELADLPVMILTAMGEAESQAMALDMGADDYLTKPFNPKVMRARVRALFRRCESRA